MRVRLVLAVALLSLPLYAGSASAQVITCYPPPQAPDMCNTRPFYYPTCYGMVYGPNYYLRPPFPPFQGMIGPVGAYGVQGMFPGCPPQMLPQPGIAAFPSHLYARSPRDYFMYDTDPRSSPYRYGNVSTAGRGTNPAIPE